MFKHIHNISLQILAAVLASHLGCTSALWAGDKISTPIDPAPVKATPNSSITTERTVDPVTGNITIKISSKFESPAKNATTVETRICNSKGELISGTFFQEVNCLHANRHYVRTGTIMPSPMEKQREIISLKESGNAGPSKVDNAITVQRYDTPEERNEDWFRTPNDPQVGLSSLPAKERQHTFRAQHLLTWRVWMLPSADMEKAEPDMNMEFKDNEVADVPCFANNEDQTPPSVLPAPPSAQNDNINNINTANNGAVAPAFNSLQLLIRDENRVSP